MEAEQYQYFIDKICKPLHLRNTIFHVLQDFVNIDIQASTLARTIENNQYYKYMLMKSVKSMGTFAGKDELPALPSLIVLMGMQNVRNFICAMNIYRSIINEHPEVKDEKLQFKPSDYIRYSQKAEEFCQTNDIGYADTAFAAGYIYDIIATIVAKELKANKKTLGYIDTLFEHGLKSGHLAWTLGETFPNFQYQKYTFAAGLLHDIGKLGMAILFPEDTGNESYLKFAEDMKKKSLPRELKYFIEKDRYGITHDVIGSQIIYVFELMRWLDRAILYHHQPYMIRGLKADKYRIAAILALASNISDNFKIPDKKEEATTISTWKTDELSDLKMMRSSIVDAVKKTVKVASADGPS